MAKLNRIDPIALKEIYWPSQDYVDFKGQRQRAVRFYDKQVETIYSVEEVPETVVVAGNDWPLLSC